MPYRGSYAKKRDEDFRNDYRPPPVGRDAHFKKGKQFFTQKRDQDFRNDYRPPYVGRDAHFKKGKQFFTKTLVCKRQPFIRLCCHSCHARCLTFEEYKHHLTTDTHRRGIERQVKLVEQDVESLRKQQKSIHEAEDKAAQTQGSLPAVVKYCVICDLNFYQEETTKHISSRLHVALKKLLEPKCTICSYNATDAVDYEHHMSSLQHLKREDKSEHNDQGCHEPSQTVVQPSSSSQGGKLPSESEKCSIAMESENLKNDGHQGGSSNDTSQTSGDISVITKVEALFCSCCKLYFSCEGGHDEAKIKHCGTEEHKVMWLKYVEERQMEQEGGSKDPKK